MNRNIFVIILILCAASLFGAPLDAGFSQAPKASASPEEKSKAYLEARYKVINAAVKYEKTPYRYGGITSSGLDCSGFVYLSFKDALGVSLPRSASGLHSWAEKISGDKAQPGDLLFFKTDNTGKISHVAIYLGDGHFIHSASAGPKTGVIYSDFSDKYWSRTFAGAGRVFPEAEAGYYSVLASSNSADTGAGEWGTARINAPAVSGSSSSGSGRLLLGVAIAPTWNGFLKGGNVVRGFSSQLRLGAETYTFGTKMIFGLEVRPEYDGALGVFRLPITFSWGPSDKIMIFAGPVFSFGDASLSTEDGERSYSGGTNWLGAIGVTAAPFIFNTAGGDFAPYLEAAWQYYFNDNQNKNLNADFSAGFRFSTGLRWSMQVN
jgi:probable lipoprotein NlpC